VEEVKVYYGSIYSYRLGGDMVATAVKKTISLPPELAKEAEEQAREEGKTLSAVIQDALRLARRGRLKKKYIKFRNTGAGRQKRKECSLKKTSKDISGNESRL